jgi:ABC-type uncharacterized transport system auxiliary subunit
MHIRDISGLGRSLAVGALLLLPFVIAASVALACASLAGCANMKRPNTAFDYSRTTGDSKEAGSHGGYLNHH